MGKAQTANGHDGGIRVEPVLALSEDIDQAVDRAYREGLSALERQFANEVHDVVQPLVHGIEDVICEGVKCLREIRDELRKANARKVS